MFEDIKTKKFINKQVHQKTRKIITTIKESNSNSDSGTAKENSNKSTLVENNQDSSSDSIQNEEKPNIISSGEEAIKFLKKN